MTALWVTLLTAAAALTDCKDPPTAEKKMNACAYEAYRRADVELNRVWSRAIVLMRQKDAEVAKTGGASCYPLAPNNSTNCLGYEAALRKAERDWLAFRDADCVISGYANRAGSFETLFIIQCREQATRRRIKDLKGEMNDIKESMSH